MNVILVLPAEFCDLVLVYKISTSYFLLFLNDFVVFYYECETSEKKPRFNFSSQTLSVEHFHEIFAPFVFLKCSAGMHEGNRKHH